MRSGGPRLMVKPPLGTAVDWGNPICDGLRLLMHAAPFARPTGTGFPLSFDVVGRHIGKPTGNATGAVDLIGPWGWYRTTNAANAGVIRFTGIDPFEFPFSVMTVHRWITAGNGGGWAKTTAAESLSDAIAVQMLTDGTVRLRGSTNADSPSSFVDTNEWTVLIVACDGNGQQARFGARKLGNDEVRLASASYGTRPGSGSLTTLRIGDVVTNPLTTDQVLFGYWHRAMHWPDMVDLLTDPFQVYRTRRTRAVVVPAGGADASLEQPPPVFPDRVGGIPLMRPSGVG